MKISLDIWSISGLVLLVSGAAALVFGRTLGLSNLVGLNLMLASMAMDWGRSAYGSQPSPSDNSIAKIKFWGVLGAAMITIALTASDA